MPRRMRVGIVTHRTVCREGARELVVRELGSPEVVTFAGLEDLEAAQAEAAFELVVFDRPADVAFQPWIWRAAALLRGASGVLMIERADCELAKAAHAAGFRGALPRTHEPEVMAAALKLVLVGGLYFPCFESAVTGAAPSGARDWRNLSRRQVEVLDQMIAGRTNKEIAQSLGISIATVKLHVKAVLAAAGARNRTEAVSRLVRLKT
jgi:two-component system nitrate/nitrite response regulator NarL